MTKGAEEVAFLDPLAGLSKPCVFCIDVGLGSPHVARRLDQLQFVELGDFGLEQAVATVLVLDLGAEDAVHDQNDRERQHRQRDSHRDELPLTRLAALLAVR